MEYCSRSGGTSGSVEYSIVEDDDGAGGDEQSTSSEGARC